MQNFGKIKNGFNDLLVEGIITKDRTNKDLFGTYIKTIKESEILRTQFMVYNNIENKVESDSFSANLFLSENLRLLEKFKIGDIINENKKLMSMLKKVNIDINKKYDKRLSDLHESLAMLITIKKSANNINEITENIGKVITFIKENKTKEIVESIDLPNSLISSIMVEKYNERYANLSEGEKEIVKLMIKSTDDEKQEVYKKMLKECIDLIDTNLVESDLDGKDKLLRVKNKLLNDKSEINENFLKQISKLVDLKASLENND
tara:strand:+ start:6329 stop:7117 length:789 start_codon:yes stop_codon:yes gene_type:complete